MDPTLLINIFNVVTKGFSVMETVWENRDLAKQAFDSVRNILTNKAPTQADVDETEVTLDAMLDEFNAPLPPKKP